jgi:hypothetical protein
VSRRKAVALDPRPARTYWNRTYSGVRMAKVSFGISMGMGFCYSRYYATNNP